MKVKEISVSQQPTNEEIKIVALLADGLNGQKLIDHMGVSQSEVSKRLSDLKLKYNCKSNAHVVAYFLRNKLID
jgi:DNA-binding CsgD family transcriptional regulator